jgi:hypothetical protein
MATDETSQEQLSGPEELRKAYKALQRELKQLQEQYEALRQQHTVTVVQQAARELGLSEKHADLFLRTYTGDEVSVDAVRAFAEEYNLLPSKNPAQTQPTPGVQNSEGSLQGQVGGTETVPPPPATFGRAGSTMTGTAVPGAEQGTMSFTDFQRLLADNPAEAARVYAEGRVEPAPTSFGSLANS